MIIEHGAEEFLDEKNFKLLRKMTYGHTTAIEIFLREKVK